MINQKHLVKLTPYVFPEICYLCQEGNAEDNYFCKSCSLMEEVIDLSKRLCDSCGSYLNNNFNICSKCLPEEHLWQQGFCAYNYKRKTQQAIYLFKYNNKIILAKPFVEQMHKVIEPFIDEFDMITYVPKFWLHSLIQNYNQAKIIAQLLAQEIKLPCHSVIKKNKWTKKQAKLTKIERLKNLKNVFKIKNTKLIKNKSILLIDDILTTGTTLNQCTKILQSEGAKAVYILTISRG